MLDPDPGRKIEADICGSETSIEQQIKFTAAIFLRNKIEGMSLPYLATPPAEGVGFVPPFTKGAGSLSHGDPETAI